MSVDPVVTGRIKWVPKALPGPIGPIQGLQDHILPYLSENRPDSHPAGPDRSPGERIVASDCRSICRRQALLNTKEKIVLKGFRTHVWFSCPLWTVRKRKVPNSITKDLNGNCHPGSLPRGYKSTLLPT